MVHPMTQPSCILREICILRCSIICLFAYYYYCDSVAVALLFSTNATCQYRLLLCFHGVLNVPGVSVASQCLCPAPWGICTCTYGRRWQILYLPLDPLTAGTDTGRQPSCVPSVSVASHCLCPAPWGICACKYGYRWQILCLPLAPLTAGTDTGQQTYCVPGVSVASQCLCPAPCEICACKYGHHWQILCLPLAPLTAQTGTGWQPSCVQMVTAEYCVFIISGVPTDVSMAFACAVNSRGGDERRAPAHNKWG